MMNAKMNMGSLFESLSLDYGFAHSARYGGYLTREWKREIEVLGFAKVESFRVIVIPVADDPEAVIVRYFENFRFSKEKMYKNGWTAALNGIRANLKAAGYELEVA